VLSARTQPGKSCYWTTLNGSLRGGARIKHVLSLFFLQDLKCGSLNPHRGNWKVVNGRDKGNYHLTRRAKIPSNPSPKVGDPLPIGKPADTQRAFCSYPDMKSRRIVVSLITSDNDYQLEQASAAEEAAGRLGIDIQVLFADATAFSRANRFWNMYKQSQQPVPMASYLSWSAAPPSLK
jgi:hypothetical protein